MRHLVQRLTVLVLTAALVAACGSDVQPHSDYFVVAFLPGTPAPSQEGLEALDRAAEAAGLHRPSFIALSGAIPATGPVPAVTQQRVDAITKAMVDKGVNAALLRVDLRQFDTKGFAERKDSFIIQLAFGTLSP